MIRKGFPMEEMTFIGKLKKLKQDLKPMTFRQKLDHIWTYYKSMVIVLLLIIMGFSLVITITANKTTKLLLAGISVNVDLSEEAQTYLSDAYLEKIGTGSSMEKVSFHEMGMGDIAATDDYQLDYYTLMSIMGLAAAKELDYMIVDETALNVFIREEALLDLRKIFTQEELKKIEGSDEPVTGDEAQEAVLAAIQITDTEFIKHNTNAKGKVFLTFTASTERIEECRAIYEYILAWQPEA